MYGVWVYGVWVHGVWGMVYGYISYQYMVYGVWVYECWLQLQRRIREGLTNSVTVTTTEKLGSGERCWDHRSVRQKKTGVGGEQDYWGAI